MKILLFLFLISSLSLAQTSKKGILIKPIKIGKSIRVEAGLIVDYKPSASRKSSIDIEVKDSTYTKIFNYYVIPYDSEFAPSRIFLYIINDKYYNYAEQIHTKRSLAKNTLKHFPNHFLAEQLYAQYCIYSKICREFPDGVKGSYDKEIQLFKDFIDKYPTSKYLDEFEWKIVQMKNYSYEYEGYANGPISEANAYEKFLKNHLNSNMIDVIKNKCAYLYRVAYEAILFPPEENGDEGFTLKDAEVFKEKAIKYYTELLSSSDIKFREVGRVALYNMKHNRTTYVGHTDW